ncbi:DUF533 domain-containing protein, partial [Salmonella enterica subsp. enterica serovar Virginia]|nr:DUF533 domain-containing protein [Salmonella enterica subsp. enterica serovar Virginia]
LILALVFAAKSDGHIDAKERAAIEHQLRESGVEEQGRVFIEKMGKGTEEGCAEHKALHCVFPAGCAVVAAVCVEEIEDAQWRDL